MPIYPYKDILPKIDDSSFVAPSADLVGDVTIAEEANIWYNCVLRGDVNFIKIDAR